MRFLLELSLNRPASEEIVALLPAEQGIREAVWTVWNCASPETLDEVTKTFTLFKFWNI